MPAPACSEDEFLKLWAQYRSPQRIAEVLNVDLRSVYYRRRQIESKRNITLPAARNEMLALHRELDQHDAAKYLEIENGTILIGSDAHYWPGIVTPAHRAFVAFIRAIKPKAVILNGDMLDGATISRFAPIGWTDSDKPSLVQEMDTVKERLAEIEDACGPGTEKVWTLGNHDGRFETKLAAAAPQYVKVHGFHLKDHFPAWKPAWACWLNQEAIVKHRFRGGVHAAHNNTVNAGKTMVTGHTHQLEAKPFSDYNGTRWGVQTGTLAECYGPQTVDYTELNPVNWVPGFVALTFRSGKLLWPEIVNVVGSDTVCFRGELHRV